MVARGVRQQPGEEEGAEGTVGTCSSHGGHLQDAVAEHLEHSTTATRALPQEGTLPSKPLQYPRLLNRHSMTLTSSKEKAFRKGNLQILHPCVLDKSVTDLAEIRT